MASAYRAEQGKDGAEPVKGDAESGAYHGEQIACRAEQEDGKAAAGKGGKASMYVNAAEPPGCPAKLVPGYCIKTGW